MTRLIYGINETFKKLCKKSFKPIYKSLLFYVWAGLSLNSTLGFELSRTKPGLSLPVKLRIQHLHMPRAAGYGFESELFVQRLRIVGYQHPAIQVLHVRV